MIYKLAIVVAICLFLIVEYIRRVNFKSIKSFFCFQNSISSKFNHASLLCLSIGLIISICAIINEEANFYYIKRLSLNSFFLGFSFPISLITFSVIFDLIKEKIEKVRLLGELFFWVINLGVILFFIFILAEMLICELVISIILGLCVFSIFTLFIVNCHHVQQKYFLTSGIFFLLMTAMTGILYIIVYIKDPTNNELLKRIIDYHRLISLYGWNLSGLAVLIRYKDFPIKLNSSFAIAIHWLTVAILAPFAMNSKIFSVLAVLSYLLYLKLIFFSQPTLSKHEFRQIF
jgi:hypothetical protein